MSKAVPVTAATVKNAIVELTRVQEIIKEVGERGNPRR